MSLHHTVKTAIIALASLPLGTQATGEDHRQQAHVHGEAQLQVAIEGNTVDLILRSPAANLLGFEHQPRNAEQEQTLTQAQEWLGANAMVQTPGGDCTLMAGSIHSMGGRSEEHDHHEEKHHDHHEEEEKHSDFEVTQTLECKSKPEDTLRAPLMKRFPGIEQLSVEWLSTDGQGHVELHTGEDDIHLEH